MTVIALDGVSSPEAARQAGVTFRQVDYWARERIVTPTVPATGTGTRRVWSAVDVAVLRAVGQVSAALLHEVHGDVLRRVAVAARDNYEVDTLSLSVALNDDTTLTLAKEPS